MTKPAASFNSSKTISLFAAILFGMAAFSSAKCASVPPPEKLLPQDTLLVLTAPNFAKVRDLYRASPQGRLWNDPALKPFKDRFLEKWNDEVAKPLERELDIKLDDYTSLPQGQVTFAVIQNGWQGNNDESPGTVLILDAKDKSAQLKSNLSKLRKKWVDSGKTLRTEKIRDIEFLVLPLSSNDVPKTIRQFFPQKPDVEELGSDNAPAKKPASKSELVIGQADSLLIVANSTQTAEKIANRMGGGSLPTLSDLAAFQGSQSAVFRDAPIYGWVNLKSFVDLAAKAPVEKKDSEAAPDPFAGPKMDKVLSAIGASGLRNLSFAARQANDGLLLHFFLSVPESGRTGLFKIIAGEAKETTPPPFVPADAVKFQRWRLDGQKVWATLERTLNELSPQSGNMINTLVDMANASAREKDPGFDVRKNLIGNLGDDMITYKKAPRGPSLQEIQAAPSIFLLGSPNPEQLVAALKNVLGLTGAASGAASEREFLGRKIFSAPMPSLPGMAMPGAGGARPKPLQYVASAGYVAMSTDSSIIEEFLRSSESQAKALRETPGLVEASQKVIGPGTGLFGFENQQETTRVMFEMLRKNPGSLTNRTSGSILNPVPGALGIGTAEKNIKDLMDFSLLPSFERISKYFSISVYGAGATTDGLTFKMFAPVPPAVKTAER